MEINISTFLLEIINFLVLIWVLKHFFYAPIQKTINERNKALQKKITEANNLYANATEIKNQYKNRLEDWQKQKEIETQLFQQEIKKLQSQKLLELEKKLQEEEEKLRYRKAQKLSKIMQKNVEESLKIAGQFVSKFLQYFADHHLEHQIIEKFISDLDVLSSQELQLLKANASVEQEITIESSYLIDKDQKERLQEELNRLLGKPYHISFERNPKLLAGLTIKIGTILLQANLSSELLFFTQVEHGSFFKK
jgi:F-type H+-transporting ATPase subunit b